MPEFHPPGAPLPGKETGRLTLEPPRLRVTALTRDTLQAWLDGDAEGLGAATGAVFPDPPDCPPLFAEDLPRFRDRMVERPHELGWWVWLMTRRDDDRAVGVCGLGGYPDADGTVELGYSVYREVEGRGYATEGARAVLEWVLAQPGVARVRATVPTCNGPSVAVARKLGMAAVSTQEHPEVGEVTVYETPPRAAPGPAPQWPDRVHAALRVAGVTLVGYVPDAGHARLIELCHADLGMRAVPLTSEEEGVGLAAGAWLGGARTALLMQSSGGGILMNALGMARECAFPLVLLVTMRGEQDETNPWQVPVGSAAGSLLGEMGVHVVRADVVEAVPLAVSAALDRAWDAESMEAVLIAQRVIGVKRFE
ncbi:MAG: GNAT family N-acetyltransferase, partial [Gemmatimonadetes bacterium]|nr:GNAT family N-acetyltransferase [Gemmatimonadota bacterium]